eukprot:TRINITY_DN7958_c0_g1_i1.p1 TRINITY_DN7958_c0_g1~~TRINITY_DN7958_c0_g1_i1.p1  ORF type:complete len:150 (-),score=32.19 TRINITY_DN7958_c0_g1_i1:47-496(-)
MIQTNPTKQGEDSEEGSIEELRSFGASRRHTTATATNSAISPEVTTNKKRVSLGLAHGYKTEALSLSRNKRATSLEIKQKKGIVAKLKRATMSKKKKKELNDDETSSEIDEVEDPNALSSSAPCTPNITEKSANNETRLKLNLSSQVFS